MKRPFAFLGFSCLFGLLVAFYTSLSVIVILLVVLLIVFCILIINKVDYGELKLSIFGIILACLSFCVITYLDDYEKYDMQELAVTIELLEIYSETDYGTIYSAKVISVNEENENYLITLYSSYDLEYDYGDYLETTIKFELIETGIGVTYDNSLKADGYKMSASIVNDYTIIENETKTLKYLIISFKQSVEDLIDEVFSGDTSDLLVAMLLGDKGRLSDELYDNFISCGVNHILVVSGMHLSILCAVFLVFLRKRIVKPIFIYLSLIPLILMYVFLTGMGKSIIRSAIMLLIILLADFLGEEVDGKNSLGLAVLLICIVNPYCAVDMGFLLSVSATAGIIILSPTMIEHIQNKLNEKLFAIFNKFIIAIVVSSSAFIFISPVLLYTIGTINPLSIICSVILVFPAFVFMIMGIFSLLLSYISILSKLALFPIIITNFCSKIMTFVCDKFSFLGDRNWQFNETERTILFCGLILIATVYLLFKTNRKVKIIALCSTFIVLISSYIISFNNADELNLVVSKNSSSVFVALIDGTDAVILASNGSATSTVLYILENYNVQNIEYIFYSETNISTLTSTIMREYDVENAYAFSDIKGEVEIFNDIIVDYNFYGDLITFEIDEMKFIIDTLPVIYTDIDCDILITNQLQSSINSALTLTTNDISELSDGSYILLSEDYFTITFDKTN